MSGLIGAFSCPVKLDKYFLRQDSYSVEGKIIFIRIY